MQTKFVLKSQIKITKNLKSVPNCSVYIFGPVDIMVIDKTDSLEPPLYSTRLQIYSRYTPQPPLNSTMLQIYSRYTLQPLSSCSILNQTTDLLQV